MWNLGNRGNRGSRGSRRRTRCSASHVTAHIKQEARGSLATAKLSSRRRSRGADGGAFTERHMRAAHLALWVAAVVVRPRPASGDLPHCRADCHAGDARPIGPTRPPTMVYLPVYPLDGPIPDRPGAVPSLYDAASFARFCDVGCTLFFEETPTVAACRRRCATTYPPEIVEKHNDPAEAARLECEDGCEMALRRCQAGFFCTEGGMLPCEPGTYRAASFNATSRCSECPRGRYRSAARGTSLESCAKCPIGSFVNGTGSTGLTDCRRCPAGKYTDEPGRALCKCITTKSLRGRSDDVPEGMYEHGSCEADTAGGPADDTRGRLPFVDPFRDSVPYRGRF